MHALRLLALGKVGAFLLSLVCACQSRADVTLDADPVARTATVTTPLLTARIDQNGRVKALTFAGDNLINGRSGFDYDKTGKPWSANRLVVTTQTSSLLDIGWKGEVGELHYVFMEGLSGFYSYFIVGHMDGGQVQEMRTIYRVDPKLFPRTFTPRMGLKTPPTLAQIAASQVLQDSTYRFPDGTIYSKYDSCDYLADDLVHGASGPRHGLWLISPSQEAFNGGPMKQEILAHVDARTGDMAVLNMIHGSHFGNPPGRLPPGKLYGPWLVYLNDGDPADAIARAKVEKAAWPYVWFAGDLPGKRATVEGRLVIADGRSTDMAMVVLAEPLASGDLADIASSYWFCGRCDASGNFRIPNVRPGDYTLYAFATRGNVTDQFRKNAVKVDASDTRLGTLVWTPPDYPDKLWSIGTADRKSAEFNLGDQPRSYALFKKIPANLTYTIGSSTPAKDWYCIQTGVGKWTVAFNLARTYLGNAHLTVAVAGAAKSPVVDVLVNDRKVGVLPRWPNDASVYRSSNVGGHYRLAQIDFPASLLHIGPNTVVFDMTACAAPPHPPGGIEYDLIKLEVGGDKSVAKK